MANVVKHLQMTDGTICDITCGTYLLVYNFNLTAFSVKDRHVSTLTPESITNLSTGEVVTNIPNIAEANLYVGIKINNSRNPSFYGIVTHTAFNTDYKLCGIWVRDLSGIIKQYAYNGSFNANTYNISSFTITEQTSINTGARDIVATVESDFSAVGIDGVYGANFFTTGFIAPRLYFKGTNAFCSFHRYYVLLPDNTVYGDSMSALFESYINDTTTQFTLVCEYVIQLGSTSTIKLNLPFKNANDLNLVLGSYTATT